MKNIIKILFFRLAFWYRDWEVIGSKEEEHVYHVAPFERGNWYEYEIPYTRTYILEKCKLTGFERAYSVDYRNEGKERVGFVKAKLGMQ